MRPRNPHVSSYHSRHTDAADFLTSPQIIKPMLRGTIDGKTPRHIPVLKRRTYQHLQFTSVAPIPTNAHEMRFLNYLVFSVGVIPLVHAVDPHMEKPNFPCPDSEHPTRVNGFCIREPDPQELADKKVNPDEFFRFMVNAPTVNSGFNCKDVNILGKPASTGQCCAANVPKGETWLVPVGSVADYCTLIDVIS
ncbi:hypothetical protein PGT21_021790 [Puccinia graminis f. sp. tritici]|uniref:Uncharacterized protein n=1 Tax=Puccinia graminis f. sp. tritici TaxID=56615 RepID=A0A5B0NS40_PUCGR|nr:hypothetical protein PGT21_021790 [Puccinia graminis f. sp. tritici]KAA1091723.1 hypothetical protein PGTUg99_005054 [Puccinia graminis f. sp. tritici]